MKRRILSLSADPELGKLRAMVLRQAGYDVIWPTSKTEADALLREKHFDVLLIGHTISGPSAREFAQVYRANNLNSKIIVVTAGAFLMLKADRTIKPIDGPEALLAAIDEVLGKSPAEASA